MIQKFPIDAHCLSSHLATCDSPRDEDEHHLDFQFLPLHTRAVR